MGTDFSALTPMISAMRAATSAPPTEQRLVFAPSATTPSA